MGAQKEHNRSRVRVRLLDLSQRLEALAGEALGEQRQKVGDGRLTGELLVGRVQKPVDRLLPERSVELTGQSRRGAPAPAPGRWTDRRGDTSQSSEAPLSGWMAGAIRAIRPARSSTARSNAASSPDRAGSATDQCSCSHTGPSSSWALSHTVMITSSGRTTSWRWRGEDGVSFRFRRCAAAIAPGWTAGAGWVPADVAGTALSAFHNAAASCERAEFAVQTNTTRTAPRVVVARSASSACGTSDR